MEQRASMERGDWLDAAAEPILRSLIAQLKVQYQKEFKKALDASGQGRGLLGPPPPQGPGERRLSGGSLSPASPASRGGGPWGPQVPAQQSPVHSAEVAGTIANCREDANDGAKGPSVRRRLSGRAAGGFSRNVSGSGEAEDQSPKIAGVGAKSRRGALPWMQVTKSESFASIDDHDAGSVMGSVVSRRVSSRSGRSFKTEKSHRSANRSASGRLSFRSARSRSGGLSVVNSGASSGDTGQSQGSVLTESDVKMIRTLRKEELTKLSRAQRRLSTDWGSVVVGVRTVSVPSMPQWAPWWRRVPHKIITWSGFDMVMGLVIIINAVTLGVETSSATRGGRIPTFALVSEYIFLFIYVVELCLRFCAAGAWNSLRNSWVKLDVILVLGGVVNFAFSVSPASGTTAGSIAGNFNMLKVLRLFRLARTLRLFVQFRQLWLLVTGLMYAVMPMIWTCFIMVVVIYVFAIVGMEFTGEAAQSVAVDEFSSIWKSMMFLLQVIFLDNAAHTWKPLVMDNPAMMIYFACFFLIGPVALMNIVTAIMVESSIRTASEDVEAKKTWKAIQRKEMLPKLHNLFGLIDVSGSGVLDIDQFNAAPEEVQEQITRIVELELFESIFELLDADGDGAVSIDEFAEGIMRSWQEGKPAELTLLVRQTRRILNELCSMVHTTLDSDRHNLQTNSLRVPDPTQPDISI